ncbi:MAG: energy transducer TonB [Sphingobium sp.]
MLQMALDDREMMAGDMPCDVSPPRESAPAIAMAPLAEPADLVDRYGARARPNLAVIAVIILLHIALFAALMQARQSYVRAKEAKLTILNLTPAPPPPAKQQLDIPPEAKPDVVAPPPIVRTPTQPSPIATAPEPAPLPKFVPVAMAAPMPSPAPPAPPSVVQAGDIGTQMVAGKPPRYPLDSRRKREQGTVTLAVTLGVDGAVEKIVVARSSGFDRLDDAAFDAVRRWRWRPTIQNGEAVRVKGVVEIPFVLQG